MTKNDPILIVRAKGPATKGGRMPLKDLLRLGAHIQSAVERVARVLTGEVSSKRGPKPKAIKSSCPLEVVAISQGSFELALDLPRDQFENMHLGVEAVEKLVEGFEWVGHNGDAFPAGFDIGVFHTLKDMGGLIAEGIDEIEFEPRTTRLHDRQFRFDAQVRDRITKRIRGPVTTLKTIEGRLLMADFSQPSEKCRIHPPMGEPVRCQFDEELEETVYDYLRKFVRVTGEAVEDPTTRQITSIKIRDIEPVFVTGHEAEVISSEEFWKEKPLDVLMEEQGVVPIERLEQVWGGASELWADDDDFESFLTAAKGLPSGEM